MKKIKYRTFLVLTIFMVITMLVGCSDNKKNEKVIELACSEVVITSQSYDLPEILIDQSGKSWNDFFYNNSDDYVYVFNNKICLTESAPDVFDTVLTITYKANSNLTTELFIHKQSLQLESLSINLNSPIFEGEWINYSVVTYPVDALHGNYTVTFDKSQYIEQQGENSFKLLDAIPAEEEIIITVTEESGITVQKSFKLPKKYNIYNVGQLRQISNDPAGYYVLQNDIDLSSITTWRPINIFNGKFDGNGHIISGIHISRSFYAGNDTLNLGLFATLSGTIKNLSIKDSSIEVPAGHEGDGEINAGIVVGWAYGGSIIDHVNVYNSSVIVHRDKSEIGGVVGLSGGTISYCYVHGITIYGNGCAGGIVGGLTGSIIRCSVFGGYNGINTKITHYAVDSRRDTGGIVGFSNESSIIECNVYNLEMKLEGNYSAKHPMGYIVGRQKGGKVYHVGYDASSCSYSPNKEDSVMLKDDGFMGLGNYDYSEYFFSCGWGWGGRTSDNPTIE